MNWWVVVRRVRHAREQENDGAIKPLPFQKESSGGGGAFFITVLWEIHDLSRSIWNKFIAAIRTRKFRMFVCNFCCYFWGQHCCWTETNIPVTICLFFVSFHYPQLFTALTVVPASLQRVQTTNVCLHTLLPCGGTLFSKMKTVLCRTCRPYSSMQCMTDMVV